MHPRPPVTDNVRSQQAGFHGGVVEQVATTVGAHDVVVVGMQVNPHVKRVKRALDEAGIAYEYLEFGGYHNQWKPRLALKIWSGWPTFPQVYVKGTLVGGADETQAMLADGSLQSLLSGN